MLIYFCAEKEWRRSHAVGLICSKTLHIAVHSKHAVHSVHISMQSVTKYVPYQVSLTH
jgi:hypothetical protein